MATEKTEKSVFKLKDIYTRELLEDFGNLLKKVWSPFPVEHFLEQVFQPLWEDLELKERMRHISDSLQTALPDDYHVALQILLNATQALIDHHGERMVFEYGFLPDFVQRFGLEQPDLSIPGLELMTRWTSAEFAVRPYLKQYPDRMYVQMKDWAKHSSWCVRRLATEGFRPRLPWGMGIPVLKKEPQLILPVLEQLKDDPSESVRRSVANNLNDISKDHPEFVLEIAEQWLGDHDDTDWIVRHACRGLLKKGHPVALKLFGFNPDMNTITVHSFQHDAEVNIGERFHFQFTVRNEGKEDSQVRLEYAIDYQTLSGKISHKVFKISEFTLSAGEEKHFVKNQRFQNFTTRQHYPGEHLISIKVNGQFVASGRFEVK
ncbi:MAG: DNA alkylation repair protein [Saprospiraceae bacterium]|nr:DNA alkylation repair protein [Lewinella sp.]